MLWGAVFSMALPFLAVPVFLVCLVVHERKKMPPAGSRHRLLGFCMGWVPHLFLYGITSLSWVQHSHVILFLLFPLMALVLWLSHCLAGERKTGAGVWLSIALLLIPALPWLAVSAGEVATIAWSSGMARQTPSHMVDMFINRVDWPGDKDALWLFRKGVNVLSWWPVAAALLAAAGLFQRSARRWLSIALVWSAFFAVLIHLAPGWERPIPRPGEISIVYELYDYPKQQAWYRENNISAANGLPPRQYAPTFRAFGGKDAHRDQAGEAIERFRPAVTNAPSEPLKEWNRNTYTDYEASAFLDMEVEDPAKEYGLCVVPRVYRRSGKHTFIVNQQGVVYMRDLKGKPVLRWPAQEIAEGLWIEVDRR